MVFKVAKFIGTESERGVPRAEGSDKGELFMGGGRASGRHHEKALGVCAAM